MLTINVLFRTIQFRFQKQLTAVKLPHHVRWVFDYNDILIRRYPYSSS